MIVVDVSDMVLSQDPKEIIRTYALGSCIGVTLYDPIQCIGGILHYQLPIPPPNLVAQNICMYANTAIPHFIHRAYELGAHKENLKICLVGGALFSSKDDMFKIGLKNYLTAKKILNKNNIPVLAEEVGGTCPRTLSLNMENGEVSIQTQQISHVLPPGEFSCQFPSLNREDLA